MGTALSVVVPVLNEQRRLPSTLRGLTEALSRLSLPTEVVVVDNGSTDASRDVVHGFTGPVPVRLLHCGIRGKGAAVRTGVLATTSPFVGFCDADLATDVDALQPMLAHLGTGVNVVIGSRAHADSVVMVRHSAMRQVGAWAFRRATNRIVSGIGETQCGFKFFDRATADAVFGPLVTTGFAFDVEVLARAQRIDAVIAELPVHWVDMPGSTFSPLRDGYQSFAALRRIQGVLRADRFLPGATGAARPAPIVELTTAEVLPGA